MKPNTPRRRVLVVSVGHTYPLVFKAVARVGVGTGDTVILVNSMPMSEAALNAMKAIRGKIHEVYGSGVEVVEVWLDPHEAFERNVARVRSVVEDGAPCRAVFLGVGGFRWLVIALWYAALAANTVGPYRGVQVDEYVTILEEDERSAVPETYRTLEERTMRIPVLSRLAEVSGDELRILELVERGYRRAKQLRRTLGIPASTLQRRLAALTRKKLLEYEKRGKSYLYRLTPIAVMLAARPSRRPPSPKQ